MRALSPCDTRCRREQIPDMEAVAERLDDQSTHSQRACAMLDYPVVGGIDLPASKWFGARGEPTGTAI